MASCNAAKLRADSRRESPSENRFEDSLAWHRRRLMSSFQTALDRLWPPVELHKPATTGLGNSSATPRDIPCRWKKEEQYGAKQSTQFGAVLCPKEETSFQHVIHRTFVDRDACSMLRHLFSDQPKWDAYSLRFTNPDSCNGYPSVF